MGIAGKKHVWRKGRTDKSLSQVVSQVCRELRPQSYDFDTSPGGRNSVENSVGTDSKSAIWPPKKSASNLDFSD